MREVTPPLLSCALIVPSLHECLDFPIALFSRALMYPPSSPRFMLMFRWFQKAHQTCCIWARSLRNSGATN
eukprot:1520883-Amphidinium_carterae.1